MKARPNPDPETALDKVFELAVKLTEVMQRGLGERGLSASRAEVLLALDKGGAMVQRQLGEALRCTPRYVTALVDALEAEGLVERGRHPTDRRATLVSLTELGAAAAARMGAERQEAARWLLGDVPRAQLGTFVAIADQVLERIGAAVPPSSPPSEEQSGVVDEAPRPRSRTHAARPRSSRTSKEPTAGQEER